MASAVLTLHEHHEQVQINAEERHEIAQPQRQVSCVPTIAIGMNGSWLALEGWDVFIVHLSIRAP